MSEHPRTDQEQWTADLLRMLGFDVKMNYWPQTGSLGRIEFDVWARLGPIQAAVECKKYGKESVGAEQIRYFHDKLKGRGDALGIFVANNYSASDLEICKELGILPLTSETVLASLNDCRTAESGKKPIVILINTWRLEMALMRLAEDWKSYFDAEWPFHHRIEATRAFETWGLIRIQADLPDDFRYQHTEAGTAFFGQMQALHRTLADAGIEPMERREGAHALIMQTYEMLARGAWIVSGHDMLMARGLGLLDALGMLTPFADTLAAILGELAPS